MKLGPYDLDQIYTGDARLLAPPIPDESIDFIFTDPVYDRIEDYHWLAETAARVLKPNGACLVWFATGSLPDVLQALSATLVYRWLFSTVILGPGMMYGLLSVTAARCFWFDRGQSHLSRIVSDASAKRQTIPYWNESTSNWAKKNDGLANWSKCPAFTERMIEAFPGIVLDPFCGGGTVPAACKKLGRRYLAFEIDPQVAERARLRVLETQPPLFIPEPEQTAFL